MALEENSGITKVLTTFKTSRSAPGGWLPPHCTVENHSTHPIMFFLMMVSVILGSSYHIDVSSSVHFSEFGFNKLIEAIKRGCDVMIDSCDWLVFESGRCMGGTSIKWVHPPIARAQTLAQKGVYRGCMCYHCMWSKRPTLPKEHICIFSQKGTLKSGVLGLIRAVSYCTGTTWASQTCK